MSDRDVIQRDRRNRFLFLKSLYDRYRTLPAGNLQTVPAKDLGESLGLTRDEADRIAEYLKDKGLIKFITMGPTVGITHYGIDYVEHALAEPDEPTEYFPPVNVLHIYGDVHGSQIQQGTSRSSQQQTITTEVRQALIAALAEVHAQLHTVADQSAREDLAADIDTATTQLKRPSPNREVLTASLRSLKTIAEKVGVGIAVAKLLELAGAAGLL